MERKKAAVLFSGGKDSCLALHLASKEYEIKYLLSVIPETKNSFMFHTPYLDLLEKQAENLGIELIVIGSKGEEEKELEDLEKLIESVKDKVKVIIAGGIASNYQGKRIKKIADDFGIELILPLWNFSSEEIWKNLFDKGFKVIITKISCEGLPKELLGVVVDKEKFNELKKLSEKYKFRIDFEGGEAETSVLFMPGFKKDIKIKYKIIEEDNYNFILDITKVD
jgi:diphthine-ammonia ligase